jgi:hypothetical protein
MPSEGEERKEGAVLFAGFAGLEWFCPPDAWPAAKQGEEGFGGACRLEEASTAKGGSAKKQKTDGEAKGVLVLTPPAKKDFWRKSALSFLLVFPRFVHLRLLFHRDSLFVSSLGSGPTTRPCW